MTQTMQPATSSGAQQQGMPTYEITGDDKKRQEKIEQAWKAYKGDLDKPLQKMPGQPDDNVLSNRIKPVVRMGIGFLFGKEIEISVEEGAPQEAQDFLNDVWGRKERRIPLLQKLAMNGGVSGQAFLRIVPDNKGDYRLITIDPATVFMETAPQDCETVLCFCIQYSQSEKINGQPKTVYYREEIMRVDPNSDENEEYEDENAEGIDDDVTWQIQHWTAVANPGTTPKQLNWIPAGEPISWDYPFPPIFHCQNMIIPNDPWGEPDIEVDLIGMNEALNLTLSSTNRIEKIYADPWVWGSGLAESVIDKQPGRVTIVPPEAKLEAVNIVSDVPNALAFSDDLRSDMDEMTRVPGVATGRLKDMPRGNVSGIALELLFMSLLMKTEEKRCLYGELIIEVSKALLVLNNMSEDIDITLAWQNPLPSDNLQAAQYSLILKQLGISNTTIQRNLGFDPEEEAALSQAEDEQALLKFSRGQGMPPDVPPDMTNARGTMTSAQMQGMMQQGQQSPFMNRGQ